MTTTNVEQIALGIKAIEAVAHAKLDARDAEIRRLRYALEQIERFGHNEGHGCGYTCATMAKDALSANIGGEGRAASARTSPPHGSQQIGG